MGLNLHKISKILCTLALSPACIMMHAQQLPSLGTAKEIDHGRLPNGIEYYLVPNADRKGFADFALVRDGSESLDSERAALGSLPHFGSRVPYRFLAENGIAYNSRGYLSREGGASVFSFSDVPVYNQSVSDSTLLMMVDIISTSTHPQAVIACGDIDAAKIKERLGLLSMMVPRLDERDFASPAPAPRRDSLNFIVSHNPTLNVAVVNAIFTADRLPREMMDTPQPILTKAYAYVLGQIVERRAELAFREAGIPLADVSYRYDDSSMSFGPERYLFSVTSSYDNVYEALRLFAAVLSDLDVNGATLDEYSDAKQKLINISKREQQAASLSNADYVKKCTASYLYGSTLASESTIRGFLATRSMPPAEELPYFNAFVSALLDCERNLTLRLDVPSLGVDRRVAQRVFKTEWAEDSSADIFFKRAYSDTLNLYSSRPKRVKIISDVEEPITGGRLWTFSNGIRVLYKKTAEKGEFRYCMMLRGGVAAVPKLGKGESAFVGDMLFLNEIASMRGDDFLAMLSGNGISMDREAGISDFRIGGIAPKSKLPLVLRSLLSVSEMRRPDSTAFAEYCMEEALRIDMTALSPRDVNSLMDSIMRPDYYYTQRKYMKNLRPDLPDRCSQYFDAIFSKVNDGMLVFMGDLDEDELKRELCRTLGAFRTTNRYAQRPKVSGKLASGSVTYTLESAPGLVGGGEIGVSVGKSAMLPYNMRNYMAFRLALSCIRRELVAALADSGAYIEISDNLEVFPVERVSLFIACKPCRADGLPEGVEPMQPIELLPVLRTVTANIDEIDISAEALKAYKEELKSSFERSISRPEAQIDAALVRYSDGKDLVNGYKQAIDSVDEAMVKSILATLAAGAGVECIII